MKKILVMICLVFVISLFGCNNTNLETLERSLFADGLLAVSEDGKYGYIDKSGELKIQMFFDEAGAFYQGYAVVLIDDEMNIIDTKGKFILEEGYEKIYHDLETGNFFFYDGDDWGMLDNKGNEIIQAIYDRVISYSEGLAIVEKNSKLGFINKDGEVVIPITYKAAKSFSNGMAAVMNSDGEWGYINKNNELVIDYQYDYTGFFDQFENAIVYNERSSGYRYALINKEGEKLFDYVDDIDFSGDFYIVNDDDKIRLYNPDLTRFNDEVYDDVWYINGFAANLEEDGDDLNILFDKDGEVIGSADYSDSDFYRVVFEKEVFDALVIYDGSKIEIYYKDKFFRFAIDDLYQILPGDEFIAERDGKLGIIDKDELTIVQFLYDDLIYSNDGFYVFEINDKYGIMNSKYEVIVSAEYDDINNNINIT